MLCQNFTEINNTPIFFNLYLYSVGTWIGTFNISSLKSTQWNIRKQIMASHKILGSILKYRYELLFIGVFEIKAPKT